MAQQSLLDGVPVVLVTVAAIKGSAPREAGACMCVSANTQAGTIGGGTLEFQAIDAARELLLSDAPWVHQQLGLGPALGQCCGGRVELILERLEEKDLHWLEPSLAKEQTGTLLSIYKLGSREKSLMPGCTRQARFKTNRNALEQEEQEEQLQLEQPSHPGYFHLLLFGAGHLGKAIVPLLATLPCSVHWIDSREGNLVTGVDKNIQSEWLEVPTLALRDAPIGSLALVMTHNHALDFEITAAALANANIAWVGLIGSNSKRRQLDRHLQKQATPLPTNRLQCPIGQRHADLRDPAELAIVLTSALLSARNAINSQNSEAQHHA